MRFPKAPERDLVSRGTPRQTLFPSVSRQPSNIRAPGLAVDTDLCLRVITPRISPVLVPRWIELDRLDVPEAYEANIPWW